MFSFRVKVKIISYALVLFFLILANHFIASHYFGHENVVFDILSRLSLLFFAFAIMKIEKIRLQVHFSFWNWIFAICLFYLLWESVVFVQSEFTINKVDLSFLYSFFAINIFVAISEELICRFVFFILLLQYFASKENVNSVL